MKIAVISVGRTSSAALKSFIDEFAKRIGRFASAEWIVVEPIKGKQKNTEVAQEKEGQRILSKLDAKDRVVLLDEKGKLYTSRQYADRLNAHTMQGGQRIVFVIGGAYGFSQALYDRGDERLALSKMTFNHELALAVFAEQLYRVLTISAGHPYHND